MVIIFLATATAAVIAVAFIRFENVKWTAHPSEQKIADRVRELGGYFQKKPGSGQRISYVNLDYTNAEDKDVTLVLQLPLLRRLDIRHTKVTDTSLQGIFAHKNLKSLGVEGSGVSERALYSAVKSSGARVYTDIAFEGD